MDSPAFINFMLTNDGNALLAVRLHLCQDNYQFKINGIPQNTQQANISSIESTDLESRNYLSSNKREENLLVDTSNTHKVVQLNDINIHKDTNEIIQNQECTLENVTISNPKEDIVSNKKNSSKKYSRKNLGRLKKNSKSSDAEQTWFKCDICGQEFKKQYLMQKHMHEHTQEKPHHCPKCPASFNVPKNFTLHMATHNIGEPKCPDCGRKFARMASLKSHMLMHEVDETLYCTECDDVFETKAQLDAHVKLHNEKWSADDYRKCKLCRKQSTQPALYRKHLQEHYKLQMKSVKQTKRGIRHRTVYKCRICMKTFEKPSQLVRHIRVHTGEKPYKCNLCERSFSQKGSVRIHMWQHSGIRPYVCSFCHAKFSQKGNLNAHVFRVHNIQEGSPIYRCSRCSCIFKKLGSLNGHLKRAHDDSTVEAYRDKDDEMGEEEPHANPEGTQQVINLETETNNANEQNVEGDSLHNPNDEAPKNFEDGFVVTDNNEKTAVVTLLDKASNNPKGKYIKIKQRSVNNCRFYDCSFCDKTFKKPSDLLRHLRIHTHEKPFECKICGRTFTLKSTMLSHEKIHREITKFGCETCSLFFPTENALQSHQKLHNKTHKCAICGKRFSTFEQLKTHSTIHTNQTTEKLKEQKKQCAPEVMNLVPKVVLKEPLVLTEVSNGLLHAQPKFRNEIAHGKGRPHKCSACPAAFMKLSHLKQHHRKHTGERPFACTVCERKFTTNSALKAHRRTHDLLKPYKCSICNTHFSTLSSMKRHRITHSNKRPYMCPYCNKTFKTTVNCRKHMKIHKQEIAQQQLEQEKRQTVSTNPMSNQVEIVTSTEPISINEREIAFQPLTTNANHNLNKQQQIVNNEEKTFLSIDPSTQNIHISEPNIHLVDSIVSNSNINETQTLHADQTGTVTLPNYASDQTFTPESIREIEESLNQQLYSIGMNLALNSSVRQIEEHNNVSLETQSQPILSIIYDNGKTLESPINTSINANVYPTHFDTFDINQISLQSDNDLDMGITQANSTNMASILPDSIQENQTYNHQIVNTNFDTSMILKSPNQLKKDEVIGENFLSDKITNKETLKSNNGNLNKENNLQCHMCNMRQLSADDLKEHLKTHQGDREFECTYCFSKFCTSGGLSRHIKIHEVQETHKCYECNQEFSTTLQLREHIKEHVKHELELKKLMGFEDINIDINTKNNDETASKKNNKCKYCPKTFRKPSDLIRHIRTHTGERPYQCQFCNKSFAVKCTLDSHLKVHKGEKSFHCEVCNSMFATKGSLKVHMRLHTGAKPFKCPLCDMKFRTSGHRKVHFVSHTREPNTSGTRKSKKKPAIRASEPDNPKNDEIMQIVQDTPQMDESNENLNSISINSVSDQIAFNSDGTVLNDGGALLTLNDNNQLVANLQFLLADGLVTIQSDDSMQLPLPSSSTVEQNEFISTNNVQNEEVNNSQVIFASQLIDSMPSITDPNKFQLNNCMVLQLQGVDSTTTNKSDDVTKQTKLPSSATRRECDVCGKAFTKPCQIERHKRIHTGERPFKCELCNKSFAQKSTLQMHQKHHTGDRPYPCPLCERSFTQSGNLQTHLKRVHKIDPAETKRLAKGQQFVHYDPKLIQPSIDDSRMLNFDDISIVELLK